MLASSLPASTGFTFKSEEESMVNPLQNLSFTHKLFDILSDERNKDVITWKNGKFYPGSLFSRPYEV